MNAASNNITTTCAACQHANLPGARFCAGCGAPLARAQPTAAADPVATPAAAQRGDVAGDLASAAVQRIGGEVLQQLAANQVRYRTRYRSVGSKFNAPLYYSGVLAVGDTPAATTVSAKIEPRSFALQLVALAAAITILLFLPMSVIGNGSVAFVVLAAIASSLWMCLVLYPGKIRAELLAAVAAESPAAATATAAPAAAIPSASTNAGANASAGAATAADPLGDALRKLAELRTLGALTEAEYAAKKAELLARI